MSGRFHLYNGIAAGKGQALFKKTLEAVIRCASIFFRSTMTAQRGNVKQTFSKDGAFDIETDAFNRFERCRISVQ